MDSQLENQTAPKPMGNPVLAIAGLGVALVVIIGAGVFFATGGGKRSARPPQPPAPAVGKDETPVETKPAFQPAPLFVEWPEAKPDLVFVLSGEIKGYLRPCGCSPDQLGGLPRRAGFLQFLAKEKNWPVVALDLGEFLKSSGLMAQELYDAAVRSLQKMGYQAVGVGPTDLGIGITSVLGQATNSAPMTFVNASLKFSEQEFLDEHIKNLKVIEIAGLKVAVAAIVGDSQKLLDSEISLKPTAETVAKILKSMTDAKADVKILLAQTPVEEAQKLAEANPGFDLIQCQSKLEDSVNQEAKWIGKTMVTWVGQKGKSVGVVGFWKAGEPKLRFEVVALDKRFAEVDAINEIYGEYIAAIKRGNYYNQLPRDSLPPGEAFVGAKRCGECHKQAYAKWASSKHSHALETLASAKPAGQDYNPDCLKCHTLGFTYKGGFVSPSETPTFGGNQCENCHGPGKRHSDKPLDPVFTAEMKKSKHTIKDRCLKCHDAENSIHFDFDKYWAKVVHPWKN